MKRRTRLAAWAMSTLAVALMVAPAAFAGSPNLSTQRIVSAGNISNPVFVFAVPGDKERLFILEQDGDVKIIPTVRGTSPTSEPVLQALDIPTSTNLGSDERGLLGAAPHPDFQNNGYVYFHHTSANGTSRIARYTISASNPNVFDPASRLVILSVNQPFTNHNAGMLAFSPIDNFLYIAMGDGGAGNDPQNNGQRTNTLLGKMLRIDVDNQDAGLEYAIPNDNPFAGPGDPLDEIWATGLRNTWRWSFDRETGDMLMGDVGQGAREEINFQPASSTGGENYGWRLREGEIATPGVGGGRPANNVDPAHTYVRGGGRCSVTGGYVYRGERIPALQGQYFFADWCSDQVWTGIVSETGLTGLSERTAEFGSIDSISSFGEGPRAEMYVCDKLGTDGVHKIISGENPDISIVVSPQSTQVDPGTNLRFDISLTNNTGQSRAVEGWVEVYKPDGTPANQNPIQGPQTANLNGGQNIDVTARLRIPNGAPSNRRFMLRVILGDFATGRIDFTDSFSFEVN